MFVYPGSVFLNTHTHTLQPPPFSPFTHFNIPSKAKLNSVPLNLYLTVCCVCVLVSSWLRQDVHSEEEEIHSSDEEDNSSTSSKEHLDEADRQVIASLETVTQSLYSKGDYKVIK